MGIEMSEWYKTIICEQLWLTYFNDTLRSKGLITEWEYQRMREQIRTQTKEKVNRCYRKKPS